MGRKRQAASLSQGNKPTRRATALPTSKCIKNSDKQYHEYREFKVDCAKFMQYHPDVQHTSVNLRITDLKVSNSDKLLYEYADDKWILSALDRSIKCSSDLILSDAQGHPFLFYARQSLTRTEIVTLTAATTAFRDQQEPAKELDLARYRTPDHFQDGNPKDLNLPATYDLTSVELGHPEKGIQLSQDFFACNTNKAMESFLRFNQATFPALKAASMMYYHLATEGGENVHQDFIELANSTFQQSNDCVKIMLGKPWSPFSQRRLICNLNSRPHFDSSNDRMSLNSLTFFGDAKLWIVVIIGELTYAFKVVAGATIVFPASLFGHFTAGWKTGKRYVLTNWTSNQLGYRAILQNSSAEL